MLALVALSLAAPLAPWSAPTGLDGQSPLRDVCVEDGRCAWKRASDVLLFTTPAVGLAGATAWSFADDTFDPRPLAGWGLGALAVTLATEATKRGAARPRPYTWSSSYPASYPDSARHDATKSFFSGHTSHTSFQLFYLASAYDLYGIEAEYKPALVVSAYTTAALGTFLVGAARVHAGKHFWSDVAVGALVGASVGLVAPRIAGFIPDTARVPLR